MAMTVNFFTRQLYFPLPRHQKVWLQDWSLQAEKTIIRSLKKTLNGLCLDDDYTIAQWLEHRWLQARVLVRVLVVTVNFSSDFSRLSLSLKNQLICSSAKIKCVSKFVGCFSNVTVLAILFVDHRIDTRLSHYFHCISGICRYGGLSRSDLWSIIHSLYVIP